MSRVAKRAQASLNRTTVAAQKTADAIGLVGIAAGGIAIVGLFKMGAELEQTILLFNTLSFSVEKGTKLFEELTEFANTTPFSNQALNKNARTLLAFGAEAEEVEQNLRMLGDVAAGDSERLGRLTLAFAQSRSAARLMGQDLLQFINAGFNPLQIISEKTGKSMLELKKQMEKGLIPFSLVEKAFKIATAEGGRFHGLTEKMAETMAGKWSTVMGKAKFLIAELGFSMKDLFLPFINGIIKAIDFLSKYRAVLFPVIRALVVFMGTLITIVAIIKIWIGVQKILNILLFANPVGAIVTAIAALVAIIAIAWRESEKFRRVVFGVWEVIKQMANAILISIDLAFKPLVASFQDLFKWAKKTGKALVDRFYGAIQEGDGKLVQLVNRINIDLIESFKNLYRSIGLNIVALDAFFSGDKDRARVFREMSKDFLRGTQIVPEGYETAGQKAAKAFQRGAERARKSVDPLFKTGQAVTPIDFGLTEDMKKLQAEGVVSGGIKTFNINIGSLTGINTVATTNMQEGSEMAGRSVINELLKALADIKEV